MRDRHPPNLVFFNPDQYRGDVLGHLGNPAAHTPNLDALVESAGVSFAHAYCQNPVCTPSRCSFMTGWYPQTRGHRTMSHCLQADEPCMLSQLRRAGYHVWWGGKNDLVSDPVAYASTCDYRHRAEINHKNLHSDLYWRECDNGRWDYSFYVGKLKRLPNEDIYLDSDWSHVLAAEEFIRNWDGLKPFCLYLPLEYPHPPYGVEEPYFSQIKRSLLPERIRSEELRGKPRMHGTLVDALDLAGRSEDWWDELRATYYGMCARIDVQAGRILQALKDRGLYDDTAFFFLSDHGDYTGDYDLVEKTQNLFEDCITRVPFIVKPPKEYGVVPGVRKALVELVDFPATVYEWTGIQPDYSHFGRPVTPLLQKDMAHRDAVFSYGGRLAQEQHCAAEGLKGHTDPSFLYYPRLRIQNEDTVAHGKAIMCRTERHKYVMRLYEEDELYDLGEDPRETTNRIHDPALAQTQDELRLRTQYFLLETCDTVPMTKDLRDVPDIDSKISTRA